MIIFEVKSPWILIYSSTYIFMVCCLRTKDKTW